MDYGTQSKQNLNVRELYNFFIYSPIYDEWFWKILVPINWIRLDAIWIFDLKIQVKNQRTLT